MNRTGVPRVLALAGRQKVIFQKTWNFALSRHLTGNRFCIERRTKRGRRRGSKYPTGAIVVRYNRGRITGAEYRVLVNGAGELAPTCARSLIEEQRAATMPAGTDPR